jgi:hypothetical protein
VAIQTTLNTHANYSTYKVPPISEVPAEILNLGYLSWRAASQNLYCYTIFDLLGACMSQAAHIPEGFTHNGLSSDMIIQLRTKQDYYAPLISLFSYWCFRLAEGPGEKPTVVSLFYVNDMIVLGSSIPRIPMQPTAKGVIQKERQKNLKRCHKPGRNEEIVAIEKAQRSNQEYGHCAESWAMTLLFTL